MRILLLGSGGREHALAWKISQSAKLEKLYIAPGNAGTSQVGENVNISACDFDAIAEFVLANNVNMVVVGPEDPLVKGVYDYFQADEKLKHVAVIGPTRAAAELEGSKSFAKDFMQRHNIPTAAYRAFTAAEKGHHIVSAVLKSDAQSLAQMTVRVFVDGNCKLTLAVNGSAGKEFKFVREIWLNNGDHKVTFKYDEEMVQVVSFGILK